MISYLERNQGGATWLVPVSTAQEASSNTLATGRPLLALGGFPGRDPALTAANLPRSLHDRERHSL
ncbi:hypothetical protein, partial [Actinomadura sp. BRA 177]|uniref:hypothetical protein n=1 Tax=Actinomadura sp. BRA 177 TaxID=2745202 RepID=UPI0015962126